MSLVVSVHHLVVCCVHHLVVSVHHLVVCCVLTPPPSLLR